MSQSASELDQSQQTESNYTVKLKDSLYWWLGKKRPFIINNEYKLELLFIDKVNCSAKILITNLKTNEQTEQIIDG
jgi:hypothetical protein